MPPKPSFRPILHFAVTPRFEVFYALRALEDGGSFADEWRRGAEQALPKSFREAAKRIAPRPMIWPLLADSLRDAKPDPTFQEMLDAITSLDDVSFQRAVLSGVFRSESVVNDLIADRQSLHDAVEAEGRRSTALLGLIGLHPFNRSSEVTGVFTRIVSKPAEFRSDLSNTLEIFWTSAFGNNWNNLVPRMKHRVELMENASTGTSLSAAAKAARVPVIFNDSKRTVSNGRGVPMFRYRDLQEIHIIPSAFNDSRFWGAYQDTSGSLRLYFPVFDPGLLDALTLPSEHPVERDTFDAADPGLVFRALGDTTRYAMACVLARSPRTSVELAKEFAVSKATISHHVQLLRSAGLLQEETTDKGIALSLDRQSLEQLSREAAHAIFSSDQPLVIKRSRHEVAKRKPSSEAKKSSQVTE